MSPIFSKTSKKNFILQFFPFENQIESRHVYFYIFGVLFIFPVHYSLVNSNWLRVYLFYHRTRFSPFLLAQKNCFFAKFVTSNENSTFLQTVANFRCFLLLWAQGTMYKRRVTLEWRKKVRRDCPKGAITASSNLTSSSWAWREISAASSTWPLTPSAKRWTRLLGGPSPCLQAVRLGSPGSPSSVKLRKMKDRVFYHSHQTRKMAWKRINSSEAAFLKKLSNSFWKIFR